MSRIQNGILPCRWNYNCYHRSLVSVCSAATNGSNSQVSVTGAISNSSTGIADIAHHILVFNVSANTVVTSSITRIVPVTGSSAVT